MTLIKVTPNHQSAKLGDNLALRCTTYLKITSLKFNLFKWTLNGAPLPKTVYQIVHNIDENFFASSVARIENFNEGHAGTYKCEYEDELNQYAIYDTAKLVFLQNYENDQRPVCRWNRDTSEFSMYDITDFLLYCNRNILSKHQWPLYYIR